MEALYTHDRDYNDTAPLILWLEGRQLNGLKLLVEALPELQDPSLPLPDLVCDIPQRCIINAFERSVLDVSLAATDLVLANTIASEFCHLTIDNCHQRQFLIPCVVRCGARNLTAVAWWYDLVHSCIHIVRILPENPDPDYFIISTNELLPARQDRLDVVCSSDEGRLCDWLKEHHPTIYRYLQTGSVYISSQQFGQYHLNSISDGIAIADADYTILCAIADRVLVESTEISRHGAGD